MLHVQAKEPDAAEQLLNELPANVQAETAVTILRAQIEFVRALADAPEASVLKERVQQDPKDLTARYQLGVRHILAGEYEPALEQMMAIMQRDRSFDDDIGRRSAVALFEMLGPDDELVGRYRKQMAQMLY